ncbi:PREDICTED: E3 SUMO-protein ligase NSE2-like isoform X3 [Sturnus vulgaris]|uniref:E3 SUMO-protein ligase NSE2-like isoform X3 n=1 Tax=Sturnus vulgaris TaxID=9172 RepID=UPI00071A6037|nr:PREDICTED: E3 SUMO-protein ligase NSE2-like isoform X3 [Sturnus vulgaris]
MSGGPRISFNAIDSALSSLKNCQSYINSGMDVATQVALDLVESFNDEEDINNMEKVMLEYAKMDRELNHYIKAFEETINQAAVGGMQKVRHTSILFWLNQQPVEQEVSN